MAPSCDRAAYKKIHTSRKEKAREEQKVYSKPGELVDYHDITEIRGSGMGPVEFVVTTSTFVPLPAPKAVPDDTIKEETPVQTSALLDTPTLKKFGQYALILRRTYTDRKSVSIQLEIQSPTLRSEFLKLTEEWAGEIYQVMDDYITIPQPYQVLFHARDKIRQYKFKTSDDFGGDESTADKLKKEMKLLEDFMENNPDTKRNEREYKRLVEGEGKVNSELLWTLFNRNNLVIYKLHDVKEYWRLKKIDFSEVKIWDVSGIVMGFDGWYFGEVEKSLQISVEVDWSGEVAISKLPLYPTVFDEDEERTRQLAIDRGKKWKEYVNGKYLNYDGPLFEDFTALGSGGFTGRVMIDFQSYVRVAEGSGSIRTSYISESELKEDHFLLFPSRIPGFIFHQKEWRFFEMDNLMPIAWNQQVFEKLKMDQDRKDLVKALVQGHNCKDPINRFDDIVENKGQGLILLLAGPPGLGKTLLAESIAEHTKKPLYSISCAELSEDPGTMERILKKIFRLGKAWNAIVLLDEADVMMSKRETGAMARNAISSVFLRVLEYYEGVLFLTTNRLADFDDAILDRIHVTLNFTHLSEEVRESIWKMFMQSNQEISKEWNDKVYKAFAKFETNGRTIKNLLRTASAFANSEKCPLRPKHVRAVVKVNLVEREKGQKDHSESWKHLESVLGTNLYIQEVDDDYTPLH